MMSRSILFAVNLAGVISSALTLFAPRAAADAPLPLSITSIKRVGNQVTIAVTNGRPTYQLQFTTNVVEPWASLGPPTNGTTLTATIREPQAFFRVVSDSTAQYQVVFNAMWSAATHPTNFPSGSAHFSGLVGGAHDDRVRFWGEGTPASEGIRRMAELGQKSTLLAEIAPAMANGTADFQLSGGGLGLSPGSVSLTFPQRMRRDYPLVTLVSMIAPSPDWFVGVDSLSLIEDEEWVTNKIVTLYGYDAGTDSGGTYTAPDQVTTPRGVVTRFTGFPALNNGVIVPFGTFTFTRLD